MFGSEAIAASMPAMLANKQLLKGISPGVRASGPFAKQIAEAQRQKQIAEAQRQNGQRKPDNRNFQQQPRDAAASNAMRAAGMAAGAMRRR